MNGQRVMRMAVLGCLGNGDDMSYEKGVMLEFNQKYDITCCGD